MPRVEHNPPMIPRLQAQTRPFVPPNTTNVLNDVCDPTLSLAAVAARYSTTVGAFCLWLERPDIADELAQIRSTCAKRAGFVAAMHLPQYADSLAASLKQAVAESECTTHFTLSIESSTLRVRYRENIRKTVALLHNIARLEHRRTPKPRNPDPTPRPRPTKPSPNSKPNSQANSQSPIAAPNTANSPPSNSASPTTNTNAQAPRRNKSPQSRPERSNTASRKVSASRVRATRQRTHSEPLRTSRSTSTTPPHSSRDTSRHPNRITNQPTNQSQSPARARSPASAHKNAQRATPRSSRSLPGPAP